MNLEKIRGLSLHENVHPVTMDRAYAGRLRDTSISFSRYNPNRRNNAVLQFSRITYMSKRE
jgi:hypothetical protein